MAQTGRAPDEGGVEGGVSPASAGRRRPVARGCWQIVVLGVGSTLLLHVLKPPDVLILPDPDPPAILQPPVLQPPLADLRQLEVTTRRGWKPQRIIATHEEIRTDRRLWASMFFRDWDRVPSALREQALRAMLAGFGRLIDRPASWRRMGPEHWDRVPQPVRAMAFMNMVARWERCLGVAEAFAIPRDALVSRLRAVAMAESWFEHRAANQNVDGSSDLGLAQATTSVRSRLRWRGAAGLADFRFEDEEYLDPLKATQVLVYWFALMLEETAGNLDLATAAYHVGSGRAYQGEGRDYLDGVLKLETRFMRGPSGSPAWRFIREHSEDAAAPARDPSRSGTACPDAEPLAQ